MADVKAVPVSPLSEPPLVRHPAGLSGEALKEALNFWLRSGRDPHQEPPQSLMPQMTPAAAAAGGDQSPWALLLAGSVDTLAVALDLGAEAGRPVFVAGPHGGGAVPASMVVVNGPLDEAAAKIRLLKAQDLYMHWDGRWPGHERNGDAFIHLIVSAQFADPSIRPKLAEAAIRDLIDETLGSQPNLILMRDAMGRTALQRTIEEQRLEVAASLLTTATQAQAQARDHQGRSALHTLAEHPLSPRECVPLVRILVAHGATWDGADAQGMTPAQLLEQNAPSSEIDAWRNLIQRIQR